MEHPGPVEIGAEPSGAGHDVEARGNVPRTAGDLPAARWVQRRLVGQHLYPLHPARHAGGSFGGEGGQDLSRPRGCPAERLTGVRHRPAAEGSHVERAHVGVAEDDTDCRPGRPRAPRRRGARRPCGCPARRRPCRKKPSRRPRARRAARRRPPSTTSRPPAAAAATRRRARLRARRTIPGPPARARSHGILGRGSSGWSRSVAVGSAFPPESRTSSAARCTARTIRT